VQSLFFLSFFYTLFQGIQTYSTKHFLLKKGVNCGDIKINIYEKQIDEYIEYEHKLHKYG